MSAAAVTSLPFEAERGSHQPDEGLVEQGFRRFVNALGPTLSKAVNVSDDEGQLTRGHMVEPRDLKSEATIDELLLGECDRVLDLLQTLFDTVSELFIEH